MADEELTEHFWLSEARCRHCGWTPENRQVLVNTARFLEKVRTLLGDRPMMIHSWCRCAEYNARVGGATASLHLKGYAADFTVAGLAPRQVQKILRPHLGKLIGGLGEYPGFTHIDRRTGGPAYWRK